MKQSKENDGVGKRRFPFPRAAESKSMIHSSKIVKEPRRMFFTLVELLIVIAVIGILVSLLLPALKKARGKAHEIRCANNEKQIGVAFHLYAQDYEGFFPPANDDSRPHGDTTWSQRSDLRNYMGAKTSGRTELLYCPANPDYFSPNYLTSYVYNAYMNHPPNQIYRLGVGYIGANTKESTPSTKAVLIDKGEGDRYLFTNSGGIIFLGWPHNNGANILFADGHVKWHKKFPGWSESCGPFLPLPEGVVVNY